MGSGASRKPAERSVSAPPEVNSQRRHTLYPKQQISQSAQDFRRKSTPSTSNPGTSSNGTEHKVARDYTIEGVGYVVANEGGPSVVLGFRPEGTSQVTSISRIQESGQYELEMDTSRDLTLSRILSADEFLARMSETDQRISNFAAVSEQDQVYDQLKDLMGLRGHLQDELLRIQAMISQDDPSLHSLEEFAHIYPHVVARIRELAARAKVIEAVATGDTPNSSRGSGVSAISDGSNQEEGVQLDPAIVQTIQHQVTKSQESESNTGVSVGVNTEQELKEKHDREERQVAAEYAKRLAAGGRNMPPGAREMILDQHLASMQALRTKQDQEKKLFELTHPKVPTKPIAKVTAMPSAKDSDADSDVTPGCSHEFIDESEAEKQDGSFDDSDVDLVNSDGESDSDDEDLTDKDQEFIKSIKKRKKISQKEFDALLAEHLANTAALRKQRKNAATRSDELLKVKLRSRSGQGEAYQEEDEETHAKLEKLDENLRKTLAERRKDMSEADLQALLAQYRKDRQQLLSKRGSEKAKHDDLLQKKLDENKRRRASLLVRRENGEATADDLEHMDDKFFQELQRKLKSGEISQEEFSSMLKNYLNTIDSNQLKQKRLEQRKMREKKKDEDARNEASNLVHESLEFKRQITSIRNREREAFDEQLRNKLAQKGKMSPLAE